MAVGFFEFFPLALMLLHFGVGPPTQRAHDPEADAARFAAVAKHLDVGGVLYAYVSVDGDLTDLGAWVDGILGEVRKVAPAVPVRNQVEQALKVAGFADLAAVGFSSKSAGSGFRNKAFFYTPNGRKGVLRLFGGEPEPFEAPALAPAGAEFVYEQHLDLKAARASAGDVAETLMGPPGRAMLGMMMKQKIHPDSELTPERILSDLDTKVIVVVDAHDTKKFRPPGEAFEVPLTHAAVLVEGLGWLADEVATLAQGEPGFERIKGANWSGLRTADLADLLRPANEEPKTYRPALLHHLPSGKLVLATQYEFADFLFVPKPNLAESREFRQVMEGLPKAGNALAYASPRLFTLARETMNDIIQTAPGPTEAGVASLLLEALLPSKSPGEASVTTNLPEGILTVSHSSFSHKSQLYTFGGAGALTLLPALQTYYLFREMKPVEVAPHEVLAEPIAPPVEVEVDALEDIDQLLLELPAHPTRFPPTPRKPPKDFEREGD